MYPEFSLGFLDIKIYTFGLALSIAFGCFFYMLHKLSLKTGINPNFFSGSVFSLVVSTFFFSRIVFVLSNLRDYEYLRWFQFIQNFLFMHDYNLSFVWGVIGFMAVLSYKLLRFGQSSNRYIDAVVLSFFFAAIIGYIGAFLWWQIYGRPTDLPIGVIYKWESLAVPYTSAIIPLAIFYALGCFLLFSLLYIFRQIVKLDGFVWYIGIALFSIMLFIGEFFSGNEDTLSTVLYFNLSQIGAMIGILFATRWLLMIYKKTS